MPEGFGNECPGGRVVTALAFVDVSEDCLALFCLDAALENAGNAAPDQLSVDYGVGCCSVLHLSSQDFIGWQLSVY